MSTEKAGLGPQRRVLRHAACCSRGSCQHSQEPGARPQDHQWLTAWAQGHPRDSTRGPRAAAPGPPLAPRMGQGKVSTSHCYMGVLAVLISGVAEGLPGLSPVPCLCVLGCCGGSKPRRLLSLFLTGRRPRLSGSPLSRKRETLAPSSPSQATAQGLRTPTRAPCSPGSC